jgi:subtilisin family serine protease
MTKFIALRKDSPVEPPKLTALSVEDRRHAIVAAVPTQTKTEELQELGLTWVKPVRPLPEIDHTFQQLKYVGAYVVETSDQAVAEQAKALLEPEYLILPQAPFTVPTPQLSRRFRRRPAHLTGWPEASGVQIARKHGIDGTGVLVGVVDTGADADHAELRHKAIDFRYVPLEPSTHPLRASRSFDVDGHGTHVTGIIAGKHVGVAPGVELMVASVIESETLRTSLERIVHALDWMLSKFQQTDNLSKPMIINMSLGFRPEWLQDAEFVPVLTGIHRILTTLVDLEVLPIVAVGNDGPGRIRAPAYFRESLSVGAVDFALQPADFSGSGISPTTQDLEPDLVGYGVDILSSLERDIAGRSIYAQMSGTSMAAPYVTGIAALIAAADPCMHVRDLRQCLLERALPLEAPRERVGAGLARFAP